MPDTYTPNLILKKPGYDSPADIKDLNDNFDKIDNSVGQLSEQNTEQDKAIGAKLPAANVLNTLEEVTANTASGMVAGALAMKELNTVVSSTNITLQNAGSTVNGSIVRKWGRLVHAQINIGISRYPEQGDSWYKIGKIPNGYIPNGTVVKVLGALEIWSVPRSLVSVSINAAGQIEAIVADMSYDIVAEQGPTIVANLFYFV